MSTILRALEKVEEERRSEESGAGSGPDRAEPIGPAVPGELSAEPVARPGQALDARGPRRRRVVILAAAGLAALLSAGGAWWNLSGTSGAATKPARTATLTAAPPAVPVAAARPSIAAAPEAAPIAAGQPAAREAAPIAAGQPAAPEPAPIVAAPPVASLPPTAPKPAAPKPPAARPVASPKPRPVPQVATIAPAPGISVLRTVWHPRPERRSARVEVEGHSEVLELREGDVVGVLVVSEIQPSAVVFLHGGARLRRPIGR